MDNPTRSAPLAGYRCDVVRGIESGKNRVMPGSKKRAGQIAEGEIFLVVGSRQ
jgi:hypothetical protein